MILNQTDLVNANKSINKIEELYDDKYIAVTKIVTKKRKVDTDNQNLSCNKFHATQITYARILSRDSKFN